MALLLVDVMSQQHHLTCEILPGFSSETKSAMKSLSVRSRSRPEYNIYWNYRPELYWNRPDLYMYWNRPEYDLYMYWNRPE